MAAKVNHWESNAEAWTQLARAGYDVYRDVVNTPAFFDALPDVNGLTGLDIGCGEGHNTRLLAARGARLHAIDISPTFVRYASAASPTMPHTIGDALHLPYRDNAFHFATAFMSLMDVGDHVQALREATRVLRPGGFLQFSITHPCFNSLPHRRLLRDAHRHAYALELGGYFQSTEGRVDRWLFSAAPAAAKAGLEPFQTPVRHRPLSQWLNALVAAGLTLEFCGEPTVSDDTAAQIPEVQDTQVVAYFLHLRARKASS